MVGESRAGWRWAIDTGIEEFAATGGACHAQPRAELQ